MSSMLKFWYTSSSTVEFLFLSGLAWYLAATQVQVEIISMRIVYANRKDWCSYLAVLVCLACLCAWDPSLDKIQFLSDAYGNQICFFKNQI